MADPENCRYLQSHEWASLSGGEATVGLSEHAQKEITDVVFVDLPGPGRRVAKGEQVAVVESVKAAFDIYSPLGGEIVAVNEELSSNPALINQSPHEKGWLFRLKASDPSEAESLMDYAGYLEFLKTAAH